MLKGYPLLQQIVLSYGDKVYFQEAPLTQFGMNYVSLSCQWYFTFLALRAAPSSVKFWITSNEEGLRMASEWW